MSTREHELRARLQALAQEREAKRQLLASLSPESAASRMGTATCPQFCPEFEMVERTLHGDVTSPFESVDSPRSIIKKYHRPAAGNDVPLPEDIRPVRPVLLDCVDYLVGEVLTGFPSVPLLEKQKFLRDRLRSIRQDLTLQGCRSMDAVAINERIARFHIYIGWAFQGRASAADFDAFQNVEQLRKVLQTLHELYDQHPNECPGQDEFTSYRRLAHLDDPKESFDVAKGTLGPLEKVAIDVAFAFHSGNSVLLQKGVAKQTPFLFQCLLESQWQRALATKGQSIVANAFAEGERDFLPPRWALQCAALAPLEDMRDLSMLLKGHMDDEYFRARRQRQQWLADTSQRVLETTLPLAVHTMVGKIVDEATGMLVRQRELLEQQRKQQLCTLSRKWGDEFWDLQRPLVVRQLAECIVGDCMHGFERARLEHVVTLIYGSLLAVCVPFYCRRVVAETLAQHRDCQLCLRATWRAWQVALLQRRYYSPTAYVPPEPAPIAMASEEPVQAVYAQLQAQLDILSAEVAREEAWTVSMAEQLRLWES